MPAITLTPQQTAAAAAMVATIIDVLRSDRGVHAETAISTAARIGGTLLFRTFALPLRDVPPGAPVLSDVANEEGPQLVAVLQTELSRRGIDAAGRGFTGDVPSQHEPQLSLGETQMLLERRLASVAAQYGLSGVQAAQACAAAAAELVKSCEGVLAPHIGFALAVHGFVQATKTMPIASASSSLVRQ